MKKQYIRDIKRVLKDNLYRRQVISTHGKISTQRLPFYKTGRIHKAKLSESGKKYHIEILLDNSGSMYNQGYAETAFDTCEKLCRLLETVADVNITQFNYISHTIPSRKFKNSTYEKENTRDEAYVQIKDEQGQTHVRKYKSTIHDHSLSRECVTNGNWDIIPIMKAYDRLMQHTHSTKIILVVADGKPNLDDHYSDETRKKLVMEGIPLAKMYTGEHIKEKVKKLMLTKDFYIFGVGIDCEIEYVPMENCIRIEEAEEIEPSFIKLLHSTL